MTQPSSGSQPAPPPASPSPAPRGPGRGLMLTLATLGFGLNFWAWALLSPLAPGLKDQLQLTSFQQALIVAVPVIVGSLGRIPVGAMTDRYGARIMFPVISAVTIVPVLYLGLLGQGSLASLLIGGFFLGISGTSFAVGVPFVNAWYPPARRGLAIGVFGVGMGGTAVSALTTLRLAEAFGDAFPFVVVAVALAIYAVVSWILLRDAPGRKPSGVKVTTQLAATARLAITWQAAALYALLFGGYVAFSVYLPAYLQSAYELTPPDASNRMAGFVVVAVAMRPVGGWLSDRFGPANVLAALLAIVIFGAALQSVTPTLLPTGTVAFMAMAVALGAGSGAVFALVALLAPQDKVGSVTGFVGAAGGLGGFVPPLLMGALYGISGSYAWGLILLSLTAAALFLFTVTKVRAEQQEALAERNAGTG